MAMLRISVSSTPASRSCTIKSSGTWSAVHSWPSFWASLHICCSISSSCRFSRKGLPQGLMTTPPTCSLESAVPISCSSGSSTAVVAAPRSSSAWAVKQTSRGIPSLPCSIRYWIRSSSWSGSSGNRSAGTRTPAPASSISPSCCSTANRFSFVGVCVIVAMAWVSFSCIVSFILRCSFIFPPPFWAARLA